MDKDQQTIGERWSFSAPVKVSLFPRLCSQGRELWDHLPLPATKRGIGNYFYHNEHAEIFLF